MTIVFSCMSYISSAAILQNQQNAPEGLKLSVRHCWLLNYLNWNQLLDITEPYARGLRPSPQARPAGAKFEKHTEKVKEVLYIQNEVTLLFHFVKIKTARLC